MYIFEISKQFIDLSKSEIEYLFSCELDIFSKNFFITEKKINLKLMSRLAYTKSIYSFISKSNDFKNLDLKNINSTNYKLEIKNLDVDKIDSKKIIDFVFNNLKNPVVNINKPENIYSIFKINNIHYLTKKIFTNDEKFNLRKAHLRKYNQPTSLHPKQARAMINLGAKKSFIDPFCGSGGILIEGALMGLNVSGSDISKKQIFIAKENLKELNLDKKVNLEVKDATLLSKKFECVITDFPFGKNSLVSKPINSLLFDFLTTCSKITNKIVLGCSSNLPIDKILSKTNFIIEKEFSIYVHKSMTRKIFLLKLKK